MSVCEQMQKVREQRRREAETRANHLAYKDANGESIDPVAALDTIAAAGLPDDWFPKRVTHYRTRAAHRATIAGEPEILRTKTAAEKVQQEAKAKLEKAQAEFAAAWNPAQQAIERATRMLNNIGGARAQLQQGCLDPAINKRRREIGDEIMEAQTQRATLEHRRNFLTNELARLQPQIEDHETRKRRVGRMGDPILTYVPGDYNAKEHAAVKRSFEQCQAELPNVEVTLLTIGPKMEALRAEEARLVAKAEASPL